MPIMSLIGGQLNSEQTYEMDRKQKQREAVDAKQREAQAAGAAPARGYASLRKG
jgi:hypothetical protein